jgi:hypothetical protein
MRKLSPQRRAELINELKLRVLFRDKSLCKRYGVSRSTLARLQREALDEQVMTQNVSYTVSAVVLNANEPRKKRTNAA